MLFASRLKLFPSKLKSRWTCPHTINQVTPFGAIELVGKGGHSFIVNRRRVKHYFVGIVNEAIDIQALQCKTLWSQGRNEDIMEKEWGIDKESNVTKYPEAREEHDRNWSQHRNIKNSCCENKQNLAQVNYFRRHNTFGGCRNTLV